ncbi:hypothetical protein KY349_00215, partial [Candidatus Woesearchaeota archaeon]|nr:hypothetical protein [Candidatus Woesearchaeota archaeon]
MMLTLKPFDDGNGNYVPKDKALEALAKCKRPKRVEKKADAPVLEERVQESEEVENQSQDLRIEEKDHCFKLHNVRHEDGLYNILWAKELLCNGKKYRQG